MVKVCESNITFLWVHRLSICPSHYLLLNHWTEFNQTCYITSPHGWGVREQSYFSMCPSIHRPSICLSLYHFLNHWVEFSQTCYIISPHCKGLREQHFFPCLMVRVCESNIIFSSVHPSSIHLSVRLSSKPWGRIQTNLLHDLLSW